MPRQRRRAERSVPVRSVIAVAAVALVGLGGCGRSSGREVLTVDAAASLTDAFDEIARVFEEGHPDVDVVLNLAGSARLREQILEGAPADVFAAAAPVHVDAVVDAGLAAGEPRVFATNGMALAVPAGNPAEVSGLADMARSDLLIGLCALSVQCGGYGAEVLRLAGVEPSLDTEEPDVRSLVTKLATGQLDAGLVYRSDAASEPAVDTVAFPDDLNVVAEYPIVVLVDSASARAFVELLLSPVGREILRDHGFGLP